AEVFALSLDEDGSILVGGNFTSMARAQRNRIARLSNSDSADSHLTKQGATLQWTLAGSAPNFLRTTLQASPDGTIWQVVAAGTRVGNGWAWTNLPAPYRFFRARGFVTGGYRNGSSSYFESTFESTNTPLLLNNGTISASGFGFEISGAAGSTVIIERSGDLMEWLPVSTNILSLEPLFFNDSEQSTRGFYRIVAP
ncbi:MAG: delta-60 repeat domain-containing protein, partial [Limisphaerales bacterium]